MSEEITTVDAQLEKIVLAMESIVSILEADSNAKSVSLTKSVAEDEPIDEVKDEPIEETKLTLESIDKSVGDDDAEH